MSVNQGYSAVKHFSLPFDETAFVEWAATQLKSFEGSVSFGTVFATPECLDDISEIMEVIRIYGQVPVLVGCCAHGLIADRYEIENEAGFTVALHAFPDTTAHVVYLEPELLGDDNVSRSELVGKIGSLRDRANSWLLFASTVSLSGDDWLSGWDGATGQKTTVGGFATSDPARPSKALFFNENAYDEGALAVALEGRVRIEPVLTHGCRPIGDPWTVTKAERNIIHRVGNRPVLEVLRDTLEGMSQQDQQMARGNIFIGLVMDEYKQSFGTGDFLVRNLAAIDPESGAVAIATPLRVGQNLQFQIRDASIASIDFEQLLKAEAHELAGRAVYGACVFDCIGRGTSLYGVPDHDACLMQEVFPQLPVSGLFCNGEFGQSAGKTMLHGYAASVALFVDDQEA